jgi:hypothetical protein
MKYINFFLILLTILLLSITNYENFFVCANNQQSIKINSNKSGCCPTNSSGITYSIVNGLCCRNMKTESEFKKLKRNKNKKYKYYEAYKISDVNGTFYCDNKPITIS